VNYIIVFKDKKIRINLSGKGFFLSKFYFILLFTIPSYNKCSWLSEPIDLNKKEHGIHNKYIVKFVNLSNGEDLVS
jgi:hypothetical protein